MDIDLATVCRFIACMSCVGSALYLAKKDNEAWGWFLFAGIIIGVS